MKKVEIKFNVEPEFVPQLYAFLKKEYDVCRELSHDGKFCFEFPHLAKRATSHYINLRSILIALKEEM